MGDSGTMGTRTGARSGDLVANGGLRRGPFQKPGFHLTELCSLPPTSAGEGHEGAPSASSEEGVESYLVP